MNFSTYRTELPGASNLLPPGVKSAYGEASAHWGEQIQGQAKFNGKLHRFLVTLPCPLFRSQAWAEMHEGGFGNIEIIRISPNNIETKKVAEIVRSTIFKLSPEKLSSHNFKVFIKSDVPGLVGAGSSTSECVASVRAIKNLLEKNLSKHQFAQLLIGVEPSDPLHLNLRKFSPIFAQREGIVIKNLGKPFHFWALGIITDRSGVNTIQLPPAEYLTSEVSRFKFMVKELKEAYYSRNIHAAAKIITESSEISQEKLPKTNWAFYQNLGRKLGTIGINVSHSGTVIGLLFDSIRGLEKATRGKNILLSEGLSPSDIFIFKS